MNIFNQPVNQSKSTISTDVPVSVKPQGGGVALDTYVGIAQECFESRKTKVKLLCLMDNP